MGDANGAGTTSSTTTTTMAVPRGDGPVNATLPLPMENLAIYDFAKTSAVDWDKVYKGHFNQLQYVSWNGLNIGRLTLAFWIIASHLALIVFVLAKSSLRKQPKNLLIINVSLTNLVMGVFLIPTKLHFILTTSKGDCDLSMAWVLLNDYYQVCVSLLAVFGLVLERLVYVYTEKRGTSLTRCATWINCVLYFVLPWVVACILVLPIFSEALVESVPGEQCAYRVRDHYFLVLQIVSFIPAAAAVFVTAPLAGLVDCLRSNTCSYSPSTPRGESLVIAVLVSVLAVFCESPYFVVRMLIMCLECNNPYCSRFQEGVTAGMWLRIAKASLMPFLWLVYSDVRDAIMCRLQYKKVKNPNIEDEDDYHLVNSTPM